jgi:hypothetical protein
VCCSCFADTVYTTEMTQAGGVSTFKTWTKGSSAKVVIVASTNQSMPAGWFIITRDGGETLAVGVPEKKQYLRVTRDQYLRMKQAAVVSQGLRVENPQVQPLGEDEGGKIAGFPTRQRRYKVSLTFHRAHGLREVAQNLTVYQSFWIAPDISNPHPLLNMHTRQTTGIPEVDRLLEFKDLKGFPMKRVVELEIDGVKIGTSTVEVKEVREQPFEESVFAIPAGYTQRELPAPQH